MIPVGVSRSLLLGFFLGTGLHSHVHSIFSMLDQYISCQVNPPVNWRQGDDVIIVPAVSNDEAKNLFPDGWETVKPYLRKVADPRI